MFGKTTELTPLAARKQLLLVESELNRVQMMNELRDFKNDLRHLRNQVEAMGAIASTAAELTDTFSQIKNAFSHGAENGERKKSWLSTLFSGAKTCASVWSAFQSRPK